MGSVFDLWHCEHLGTSKWQWPGGTVGCMGSLGEKAGMKECLCFRSHENRWFYSEYVRRKEQQDKNLLPFKNRRKKRRQKTKDNVIWNKPKKVHFLRKHGVFGRFKCSSTVNEDKDWSLSLCCIQQLSGHWWLGKCKVGDRRANKDRGAGYGELSKSVDKGGEVDSEDRYGVSGVWGWESIF